MYLTENQREALNGTASISFGQAANALSILVGQRVLLTTPNINMCPVNDLEGILVNLAGKELAAVHQVFSGKLSGDIMLLLDAESASQLVDLLEGGKGTSHALVDSDREALIELGNIILNSFIGSFGNLLNIRITFTVPQFRLQTIKQMVDTLQMDQREVDDALIVEVNFQMAQGQINGYVIIVMGNESLEAMFDRMRMEGYLIE